MTRIDIRRAIHVAALAVVLGLAWTGLGRAQDECVPTVWNLTAGQYTDVGSVTVTNDDVNVYVTYTLDYPGATFGELHLWIGNDLKNMPATKNGTPIPGQFCQADGGACYDATGLTTHTFTMPLSELSLVDVNEACGLPLYVVTHAEVDTDGVPGEPTETAFGGDTPGPGPRWWFYGIYTICCGPNPPPPPPICSTSFAKGGWVWTTDRKSNPESLPSLGLTKNRWGWAINLTAPGETTYDIWMGAGLNRTANGVLVGSLMVAWDGAAATITYAMNPGYDLEEVHVYAGDAPPMTTAPGQYGCVKEFDPNEPTHVVTLPLVDTNSTGGVWIVAHAVVCTTE